MARPSLKMNIPKSRYPRIVLEDFESSMEIIKNCIDDHIYLSAAACSYSPIMREEIRKAVEELKIAMGNIDGSGRTEDPEDLNLSAEQQLMSQIDRTIRDIRALIKAQDSSEASKVSASKFLFELIQKRVEIFERLANIERVYSLEALIKEFIEQHAQSPDVAKHFIERLQKLNRQDKGQAE